MSFVKTQAAPPVVSLLASSEDACNVWCLAWTDTFVDSINNPQFFVHSFRFGLYYGRQGHCMSATMTMGTLRNQSFVRRQVCVVCLVVLVIALECHAKLKSSPEPETNSVNDYGSAAEHQESCQLHAKAVWEGQALFRELFESMPRFVGIASAGFYVFEGLNKRETFDPNCTDLSSDSSCWIKFEGDSSGHAWKFSSSTNLTVSFQGNSNCTDQKLSGSGTTEWRWTTRWDFRVIRGDGEWSNGKQQGAWTYQIFSAPCLGLTHIECRMSDENTSALKNFEVGSPTQPNSVTTLMGHYEAGKREDRWVANFSNGDIATIPYASDLKHGTQSYRSVTLLPTENKQLIDHYEIPWIEGKKHGRQIKKCWNGDQVELPWKDGTMHGEAFYSWSTDEQEKVQWVNGKQHGTAVLTWPDGSRLTTRYDQGTKMGDEEVKMAPTSGTDVVSLHENIIEKKHRDGTIGTILLGRTITRRVNGIQHGLKVLLHKGYSLLVYLSYKDGNWVGTHIGVSEGERSESMVVNGRHYGMSVFVTEGGYRRETPHLHTVAPHGFVIETTENGNYRSLLSYVFRKSEHGTSVRCWYKDIPWANDEDLGIEVFSWPDGGRAISNWEYISWHGPLSFTESNGLCLETMYSQDSKRGIEVQTQTNGYKAHIPVRGRLVVGRVEVFSPDSSPKE